MTITGKQLRIMPLHAVTEVYGEAGLRRRLDLELDDLPGGPEVAAAADWATELHSGQRRVREPYINHLLRVALRIRCHYRVGDVEVLIAALLHDSVEDQASRIAPSEELAFAEISHRHGHRVAALVRSVTNPPRPAGADRIEHYLRHLRTALDDQPWARVLKLSDFTDNGVGLIHTSGPRVVGLAEKYRPAVAVLRDLLDKPDTPLPPEVRRHIHRQLDLADQRIAAILSPVDRAS